MKKGIQILEFVDHTIHITASWGKGYMPSHRGLKIRGTTECQSNSGYNPETLPQLAYSQPVDSCPIFCLYTCIIRVPLYATFSGDRIYRLLIFCVCCILVIVLTVLSILSAVSLSVCSFS